MGFWDFLKGDEFEKGRKEAQEKLPTRPDDISEPLRKEAHRQASEMKQEIQMETLLNSNGASRAPIEVIHENEDIKYMIKGLDVDIDGDDMGSLGYTLVTEERVISAAMKIISSGVGTQHSISFQNISDISIGTGMFTSVLEIRTPGHEYEITGMNQKTTQDIYDFITNKVRDNTNSPDNSKSMNKLERLADLREQGAISEDEYQNKKSELLDEL